ncbi:hypothetical protein [Pelagibacterium luteolum]|uniref:Uncharacterized protein n=1 Tax=Pelagibacterium luteolum TaxID=440168 RepID=A0A1G7XIR7_9HYPH|nr:hypothetical protein [Pelagibacterium luteolum]SDG84023.1 hypothetical protein SAMN04487974_109141 [Pelagibacterium luteolum]
MALKTIDAPFGLTNGVSLSGLTAPSMRVALALICQADGNGAFSITKPLLEKTCNVRLDNAHRFLNRPRDCQYEAQGEYLAPAFERIDYVQGERGVTAGIISGQLTMRFVEDLVRFKDNGVDVKLPVDELRMLSTIPGILLWLRLARERSEVLATPDDDGKRERVLKLAEGSVCLRLQAEDAAAIFGQYTSRATVVRANADGEEFRSTSLSRIYEELVKPAVTDLWKAMPEWDVDARPVTSDRPLHGRAWKRIDLTMAPLWKRPSLKELAKRTKSLDERQRA